MRVRSSRSRFSESAGGVDSAARIASSGWVSGTSPYTPSPVRARCRHAPSDQMSVARDGTSPASSAGSMYCTAPGWAKLVMGSSAASTRARPRSEILPPVSVTMMLDGVMLACAIPASCKASTPRAASAIAASFSSRLSSRAGLPSEPSGKYSIAYMNWPCSTAS